MTKKLLLIHKFPKGWTLYGKTGNGQFLTLDRATKTNFKYGWFIGWIENGKDKITFTYHLEDEDDQPQKISAGQRAKEKAIKKLYRLITNIQP